MLRLDFVTLFPEAILPYLSSSILGRAAAAGHVQFGAVNPRDFAEDKHRTVDDAPFGGGPGMLMMAPPVAAAIRSTSLLPTSIVILTEPTGKPFRQADAQELSATEHLVFVAGHYEGIDTRIAELFKARTYSIGDFVLTGGELPALVMADAVVRLLPGVLGDQESLRIDSHSEGLLSAPQYTRPVEFEGLEVPEVLRSGDHGAIAKWKRQRALRLTRELRPDLFCSAPIDKHDLNLL